MRKLQSALLASALLLIAFPFDSSRAQVVSVSAATSRERYGIDRYLNIRAASSPSLSQTGDRVAFLTNITGTAQVWMVGAQGGWPDQLTFYSD